MFSRKPRYKKYYRRRSYIPRNRFKTNSYSTKIVRKESLQNVKYPINNQSIEQFASYIEANSSYFPYLQRVGIFETEGLYTLNQDSSYTEIDFFNPQSEISIFHRYPNVNEAIVILDSIEYYCPQYPTIPISYGRYLPKLNRYLSVFDFSDLIKNRIYRAYEDHQFNFIPIEQRQYLSTNISGDSVTFHFNQETDKMEFLNADELNLVQYYADQDDQSNWPGASVAKRIFPFSFINPGVDSDDTAYDTDLIVGYCNELYNYLSKAENIFNVAPDPQYPKFYVPLGIYVYGRSELSMHLFMTLNDQAFYDQFENQKDFCQYIVAFPCNIHVKAKWSIYVNPSLHMDADNSFFIRNAP